MEKRDPRTMRVIVTNYAAHGRSEFPVALSPEYSGTVFSGSSCFQAFPKCLDDPFLFRPATFASLSDYLRRNGGLSKRTAARPFSIKARMLRWSSPLGLPSTAR